MTDFVCDAYTGATPLAAIKAGEEVSVEINIEAKGADINSENAIITANVGDSNITYHANSINTTTAGYIK